ncbi:helix-turn-helix transcriptional regulator [Streptomyces sp. AV19]|uniref:helix-turn-helix domain-containing protein n=1 Tax=Streptomyces sp. AV19 TaxID=2793068 RepID=UPI0018FE0BD5|nr:helix-turn-helix transcriptional regulator [Streptomyces sp. AV19]MBH1935284.1 helix-turn-helix transcriptional regulator [Streptomyces sp. AV19]MDG4531170.1 helix-turn-helix domain-containing protein [Streptomyces sp. AV19]
MANEHLGDRVGRLRRLADLTQEALAERAGVSADVVRKLEQKRKHSARLPTLHALAKGLGVEVTALLGDPPGIPSNGEAEPPALVAVRRAIVPPLFAPPPEPSGAERLTPALLRSEIEEAWTLYHSADFGRLLETLPDIIADSRLASAVGDNAERAVGQAALAKSLQLAGHLSIRLGKTDLALSALERALAAAREAADPLLPAMVCNSVAWAYQRQNRLDDALRLAVHAADRVERSRVHTAEGVRVRGGLLMSAATSSARSGDYDTANDMMRTAERAAGRLATLPPPVNGKLVSVFSRSSVRIERVRLSVQHGRPEEALRLARGMRLAADTPISWRTWLLLDVARAHADVGNAREAVKSLEKLHRLAPAWMRHHTLAVAIVGDLWSGPSRPPGLRRLAELLGVAD